jgi:N-acetylneuraminic acid mutarotase
MRSVIQPLPHFSFIGSLCLAISLSLLLSADAREPQSGKPKLTWKALPDLPDPLGVAGPFVGVHNNALLVAGGANFPEPVWDNEKKWHDHIYLLEKSEDDNWKWKLAGKLPRPIAYGAAVSTQAGLLCMGGNNAESTFQDVFLLSWNPESQSIETKTFPDLPEPCAYGAATLVGEVVYLAGGQSGPGLESAMSNFWSLDLSQQEHASNFKWQLHESWPGKSRAFNLTVAQHNGKEPAIYVISGRRQAGDELEFLKDVWEFGCESRMWRQRTDAPRCLMAGTALAQADDEIFVLGGADEKDFFRVDELRDDHPGFPKEAFCYQTASDQWVSAGKTPANQVTTIAVHWNDAMIVASGEVRPRVRSPKVWQVQVTSSALEE